MGGSATATIEHDELASASGGTPAPGARTDAPVPSETSAQHDEEAGTGPNLNVPKDDEDDALPLPKKVSAEESDRIRREAYLKATGKVEEKPEETRARDESGRFKPKAEPKKEEGPSDTTEEGRELIFSAKEILRKAQYPLEDIENMSAGELMRRAKPLNKMFSDTQKAWDELNELRQKVAQFEGKKSEAPAKAVESDSKQRPDPDAALGAEEERLEALLAEYGDDDLTKIVRNAISKQRDNAAAETKRAEAEAKAAREQAAQAIVRQVHDHVGSVRRELEAAYPKLKDDAEFEDILQRMEAKEAKRGYPSVAEGREGILNLMAGVAFVKYGKQLRADQRDELIRESRAVRNGHPSASGIPSRGISGNNGTGRPDPHDLVRMAMRGGGTFEDMQRRLHSLKTGAGQ